MTLEEITRALQAQTDEIRVLLQHPTDELIRVLLNNENMTDLELSGAIRRTRLQPKTLEVIAGHPKWQEFYRVHVALAHNLNTPHRLTLSFIKSFQLFDLMSLLHSPNVPSDIRVAAERLVLDRLKEEIPWGTKISVARRATTDILDQLVQDPLLAQTCLDNRRLREVSLLRAINMHLEDPALLDHIATHFIWSTRYQVRLALAQNKYLPERRRLELMRSLRGKDLDRIVKDATRSVSVHQCAKRTLTEQMHAETARQSLVDAQGEARAVPVIELEFSDDDEVM